MLLALATFTVAAVLIILFPGPDTLVVLRSIVRGGRARGLATAAGILTGLVVWIGVAALGLAAVLRASEVAYDVLRIAGACYLTWLGLQSLRAMRRSSAEQDDTARRGIVGTGFVAGLVTNLLNPKVGVFFVTFLPGFVPSGYPVGLTSLLFGAVFVVLTVGYFVLLLAFASRLTEWMTTPRVRRRLDAVTGTVLVGFGVRLAAES
jgi:RhtB (resistance to homoserine/threonine) family protein